MALNTKIWESEVQKYLYEMQDYTRFSKNFKTENVKTYSVPNAGAITASVDNGTRPLVPGLRTDTEVEISLEGLKVDPFYVSITDQYELSYDKRASITEQMAETIGSLAKQKIFKGWLDTADFTKYSVKTSGAATASKPTGATGTRKKMAFADIMDANEILDLQDIPADGRVIVIHPSMHKDVKALSNFTASESISTELLSRGVIGYIDNLMVVKANINNCLVNAVASGTTADASGVTFGATGTTYSYVAVVYHPNFVGRVIGRTELFINTKDAIYTSDVMSSTLRVGGGLLRDDKKGFVPIVQEIG